MSTDIRGHEALHHHHFFLPSFLICIFPLPGHPQPSRAQPFFHSSITVSFSFRISESPKPFRFCLFACLFTLKIQFSFVDNTSVTDRRPTYRASICLHTVHSPTTHHQKKEKKKEKKGGGGGGGGKKKRKNSWLSACRKYTDIEERALPASCRLSTVANTWFQWGVQTPNFHI